MSKEVPARPDYYSWTKDAPVYPDWKKPKKDVKDQPQVKEDIWTIDGFQKLMENKDAPWVAAGIPYSQWRAQQQGMSKEDMKAVDFATKKGDSAAEKLKDKKHCHCK